MVVVLAVTAEFDVTATEAAVVATAPDVTVLQDGESKHSLTGAALARNTTVRVATASEIVLQREQQQLFNGNADISISQQTDSSESASDAVVQ